MQDIIITIKIGRRNYDITSDDRFLDNGCCVQLVTQEGPWSSRDWSRASLVLPLREIKRISKFGKILHRHGYIIDCKLFSLNSAR